jgi:hypothetical protein
VEHTEDGIDVGFVGIDVGCEDGTLDGCPEGALDGSPEGCPEGVVVGEPDGVDDGIPEGCPDGLIVDAICLTAITKHIIFIK